MGERTQATGHRVLAGGAQTQTYAALTAERPTDPLVWALAQLVRDRWAAEQSTSKEPVALLPEPSNMAIVAVQSSPLEEQA